MFFFDKLSSLRLFLAILLLSVSAAAGTGHAQTVLKTSGALNALIQQADQTYARAGGMTLQDLFNNDPQSAAVVLGLAMYGQQIYLRQKPAYTLRFKALYEETISFLSGLASAHQFINPRNSQPMNLQILKTVFDNNMMGYQNKWAVQNGLPDPAKAHQPLILDRVILPSDRKRFSANNDNAVNLLGQAAPPAPEGLRPNETAQEPGTAALSEILSGEPGRQDNATPPSPAAPQPQIQRQPIGPGAIVGRWQGVGDCTGLFQWGWLGNPDRLENLFIDFRQGAGKNLYIGRLGQDTFYVRSEKQTDPFTIEYTAVWESRNIRVKYSNCATIVIKVFRGKKNNLLLCRGGCMTIVAGGYIKKGH